MIAFFALLSFLFGVTIARLQKTFEILNYYKRVRKDYNEYSGLRALQFAEAEILVVGIVVILFRLSVPLVILTSLLGYFIVINISKHKEWMQRGTEISRKQFIKTYKLLMFVLILNIICLLFFSSAWSTINNPSDFESLGLFYFKKQQDKNFTTLTSSTLKHT